MAQRFRETASIDSRLIRKVEGEELREKLQGLPASRLTESLREGGAATGWEVPISMYDVVNANGRYYPKALWEKVIKEQQHIWKGAPMLADHPADDADGSPQNICGVWLEARVAPDNYVYGTFVPSGRLGEDLQDHLSKGLRAGTSSSGFGDLMRDGKTVDPSTYLIERLSDWVLTPSQGTYFTYEAATRETKNASESSRMGESANKVESVVKENVTMAKLTKLEEKKFRKDMEIFLEDASKIDDPQGRLKEFEEILSYLEDGAAPDLRERVETKIAEQKTVIAEALAEAKKMKEELGVTNSDDLKKKLSVIADDTAVLQEENNDWKQIASVLQEKLDKAREDILARPTDAYVAHLKSKISKVQQEKRALAGQIKKLDEKILAEQKARSKAIKESVAQVRGITKAADEQRALIESLKQQVAEAQELQTSTAAKLAEAEGRVKELRVKLAETGKVTLAPSPATSVKKYVDFREGAQVDSYWGDLLSRHGEDIKPFEEKIRSCKTVREATAAYFRVLPLMEESQSIDAMRLPESVALSMKDRGAMLEKVGVKVDPTDITDRLPKGWQ